MFDSMLAELIPSPRFGSQASRFCSFSICRKQSRDRRAITGLFVLFLTFYFLLCPRFRFRCRFPLWGSCLRCTLPLRRRCLYLPIRRRLCLHWLLTIHTFPILGRCPLSTFFLLLHKLLHQPVHIDGDYFFAGFHFHNHVTLS